MTQAANKALATRRETPVSAAPLSGRPPPLVRRPGQADLDPRRYFARRRWIELGLAWVVPVLFVGFWQAASSAQVIDPQFFPAPSRVWSEGVKLAGSGVLGSEVWISTQRILAGFGMGVVSGIAMGVAMGTNRTLRAALDPLLTAFYTVPKLALLPLLLLVFGLGEFPMILLIAIAVFFFMWLSTMGAFLAIPEGVIETAKSFGANRWQLFRHAQWPSALPQVFVGLRLCIGMAVLVDVGVEFVQGSSGIGWYIWNSWSLFLSPPMYVGIVAVALMGVIGTFAVRLIGRALLPWVTNRSGSAATPF